MMIWVGLVVCGVALLALGYWQAERGAVTVRIDDPPGVLSTASFRTLEVYDDMILDAEPIEDDVLLHLIGDRISAHGPTTGRVVADDDAYTLLLGWKNARFRLLLRFLGEHPEEWVLTLDAEVAGVFGAPTDDASTRELLWFVHDALAGIEVTDVHWFPRQMWRDGARGAWTARPVSR
ncbi:MAG: hypothetical protein AAGI01_03300 [Myxococcota bacterium]